MKNLLWAAAFLLASVSLASAQSWTHYDWRSGNSYSCTSGYGSTSCRGSNYRTGSSWSQTQRSDGTYSGYDADGNYYSGNNRTGSYHNFGTGASCFGRGAFRTCN